MIRIPRPLLVSALAVVAACAPPATAGAEGAASVPAGAEGGVSLLNAGDAVRSMDRFYDPLLRDAGVTGTVTVDVALEADGSVRDADVHRSTHDSFSESAMRVAPTLRFSPPAVAGAVVRVRMQFIHRLGEIAVVRR